MSKIPCDLGKRGLVGRMAQILSGIDRGGENWDAMQKLLDELDALFPSGSENSDLDGVRSIFRSDARCEHPIEPMVPNTCGDERSDRLLRLPEVIKRVGLKKSAIYDKIRRNQFPKSVAISKRARAWRASKIAAWIADRN